MISISAGPLSEPDVDVGDEGVDVVEAVEGSDDQREVDLGVVVDQDVAVAGRRTEEIARSGQSMALIAAASPSMASRRRMSGELEAVGAVGRDDVALDEDVAAELDDSEAAQGEGGGPALLLAVGVKDVLVARERAGAADVA